jgi:hypothetical protein
MMDLPVPLAVVAHDAGAANIILAWIEERDLDSLRPVMRGPAEKLWHARFGEARLMRDIDAALDGAAALLSGTGWASDLEHDARAAARSRGLHSVAVVDHWVNYRARFERGGEQVFPDELWVTDSYAVAEAHRALGGIPVRLQPNRYLRTQVEAAGPAPEHGDLLFVSEPARSDWGRGKPGEFQALDYLALHRDAAGVDAGAALRIRPHPSDPAGKYADWIERNPGAVLDASADMADALRSATWVAGLNSFALAIALEAGRRAICALPPGAPDCVLPHEGLIHLRALVGA